MQNIIEIRRHIRSVEQTRKLTNAMHLISSARMRKLLPAFEYNSLYQNHIEASMHDILQSTPDYDLPYLRDRGAEHKTYIVIAGDKGMVGSYNNDIQKFAWPYVSSADKSFLIVMGITASRFFIRKGIHPDLEIYGASQDPSLENARHLTQDIFRLYDSHRIDQVYLIYTEFVSSVKWYPTVCQLLPLQVDTFRERGRKENMIYHPSPREMFRLLMPQYTLSLIYGALMKSYASELCARMNSMQEATRNADELLGRLKTSYNIARQAAITQEITEIMGSARAQTGEGVSF